MSEQVNMDGTSCPFEVSLERLQEIVALLEKGDVSLDMGMQLYREGMMCARGCRESLQKARHEISVWQNGEDLPFLQQANGSCEAVAES